MYWANFLHFYQPAKQQSDILEAVVVQSYRPILEGIDKNPNVKLTLNINGALIELFNRYKYHDLIDLLRKLAKEGKIEFTSSSKYHAFLPLVEEKEIIRQIKANDETNRFFLGDAYQPKGFFPPEMGWKKELAPMIESLGFEWVILDEIACGGHINNVDYGKISKIKGTNLSVYFRERRLSNLIMSAVVRSRETLLDAMRKDLNSGRFLVTAMDGETFGHHRPGLEKLLFEVFDTPEFELVKISDLPRFFHETVEVEAVESTWASSVEDIKRNVQFLSWSDPENIIHAIQWKFLHLVMDEFYKMDQNNSSYKDVRQKMDIALSSDPFWWASAKPWWSLEMIEEGAYRLLETLRAIPNVSKEILDQASKYYEEIVSMAFNWQRSGKIRQMAAESNEILRIPFKDRTLGTPGKENVYHAFLDMMKGLEKKAAENGEYEKAILWRDAIYKLDKKLDIYDTVNAIDLLRVEIPNEDVEKTIIEYEEKYKEIRGGQPEQRGA